MNNNKVRFSYWAVLPVLFCSAAVLAGDGGYDEPVGQIPSMGEESALTLEDDMAAPDADMAYDDQAAPACESGNPARGECPPAPAIEPAANAAMSLEPSADMVAAPDTMSQAQQLGQESDGFLDDATATSSLNTGYVGGNTRIGVGIDSELKGKADVSHVFMESETSATIGQGYLGVNPKAKSENGEETLTGAGAKLSHHWVSTDANGQATHVNKVFGAYDQNEQKDKKVTFGYGQENQNLFWSGNVSKGLSGKRDTGMKDSSHNIIYEKAYDYGIGGRVGTYLPGAEMRVQGGLDYEWGKDYADTESKPHQVTLSGGVEKFFPDSPHSINANLDISKKSGGYVEGDQKADVRGGIGYRYDFGSAAGIWQPDQKYRRVRVEIPGEEITQQPKVERKLVKHTMELEADTFFELDKATLTPAARERLNAVLGQIRASGHEGNIRITGNTCDLGSDKHNLKLSQRRANAVRDFMAQNGFSANELLAEGLGESQPKYPNTPTERHKNRRVDIEYVTYQAEYKDKVITQGGTTRTDPKVVWKQELIPTPPLWVRQALHNVAEHKERVDTYKTIKGNQQNPGGENVAPEAVDDEAETTAGVAVYISVLDNDSDPDDDDLSIVSFTQGGHGSVTQDGDQLVYTPEDGFTGTDTFTYTISDGHGHEVSANVTVTVNEQGGENVPPKAVDDTASTAVGVAKSIPVLANDSDDDGDYLSIVSYTQGAHGSVTQSGNELVYTPADGFTGEDSFTYTISDGHDHEATATVHITVTENVAPQAVDDSAETYVNVAKHIAVLENDSDGDGDTLSIVVFTQGSHGSVSQDGDQLIYTPETDYEGDDSFTYTISDGNGHEATATVQIRVSPADGKVDAMDDAYPIDTNTPKDLGILANDEIPAGAEATISIVSGPAHGSVEIKDGYVTYTPETDYEGDDSFVYKITVNGVEDTATVELAVGNCGCNSDLTAVDDTFKVYTNNTLPHTIDVLANDTGTDLTIIQVSEPAYGTAVISDDGKSIVYTLRHGYCADHSFTYTVRDKDGNTAQATVYIDVI